MSLRGSVSVVRFLLAVAVWIAVLPAQAQDVAPRLRELVRGSGIADLAGIAVVDLDTGRPVFQHHADRAMNPASNEKLITAFAALRTLGSEFHMRTAVYGRIEG